MTESIRPPIDGHRLMGLCSTMRERRQCGLALGDGMLLQRNDLGTSSWKKRRGERADRMQIPAIAFFGMLLESLDFGRLDHTLSTGLPPPSQTRRSALTEHECRTQSRLAGGQRLSSERPPPGA